MKRQTKIGTLHKLFLDGAILTNEQVKNAVNLRTDEYVTNIILRLRKGTKLKKDGTYKRPPLNIQSVKKGKRYNERHYKLISKRTSNPSEAKEVLLLAQKKVSTMGKDTFKPTAITFFSQVKTIEAKKFILLQQEKVMDSYLIEEKT